MYSSVYTRLESFKRWRRWDVSPSVLAYAGFYFTGESDIVQCYACELQLYDWVKEDDPVSEHVRLAQKFCSHMEYLFSDFVSPRMLNGRPVDENARCIMYRDGGPHSPGKDYQQRLASFASRGWAITNPSPKMMAEAGFYCYGPTATTCYFCGWSISSWERGLDPKKVHSIFYPQCFLSQVERVPKPTSISPIPSNEERCKECILCASNVANVVSAQCLHIVGCMECVLKLKDNKCPICRAFIGGVIQIRI